MTVSNTKSQFSMDLSPPETLVNQTPTNSPVGRVSSGLSRSPTNPLRHFSPGVSLGSEDSWSQEDSMDFSTGNLSAPATPRLLWPRSETFSDLFMQSYQDQARLMRMFGKKILPFLTHDSSWELQGAQLTPSQIGTLSGRVLNPVTYNRSLSEYVFEVTTLSGPSLRILQLLWEECEQLKFFGVQRELERVAWHGMKLAWKLTLKIRAANSGLVTALKNTLL